MGIIRVHNSIRKHINKPTRVNNSLITREGANTVQARGYTHTTPLFGSNPYFNINYTARWQEYTRLYNTSWEVRKIVDIPVDDAFRTDKEISGVSNRVIKTIKDAYIKFDIIKQLKKALKQERLYGGCVILPILKTNDNLATPLDISTIEQGDLLGFNVIDVSRLSRVDWDNDPFKAGYDRCEGLRINGQQVAYNRMIVFDGDPLIGYANNTLMGNQGYSPCGFGESKITTLYDLLIHSTGTQQAAYHLVNMSSVLLLTVENLRSLQATGSPALDKMNEIVEQLNMYRGAVLDGKDAKIEQHSASFGSVPELVLTFCQLLSAASDIPATRFLGQAPGGLNATGESDTRNYYDMVDGMRNGKIYNAERRIIDLIGASTYGYSQWYNVSKNLELTYRSLWSLTESEQANIDKTYSDVLIGLYNDGILDKETVVSELNARNVFMNKEITPVLDTTTPDADNTDNTDVVDTTDVASNKELEVK